MVVVNGKKVRIRKETIVTCVKIAPRKVAIVTHVKKISRHSPGNREKTRNTSHRASG